MDLESERLARQLMAEEAMEAHTVSQYAMLESAEDCLEEDSTAIMAPSPQSLRRQQDMEASERLARRLMAEEAIDAHTISQHTVLEHTEDSSEKEPAAFVAISSQSLRQQQDIEASERLARQLMAEEAMDVHAISQRAMLEHVEDYSEEDLRVLREAIAVEEEVRSEEEEEEENYEEDEEEEEEIDYDRLLQLGEFMGDVKEERWKERAQAVIDCLPTRKYNDAMSELSTRCTICQCEYEANEELRLLPCSCFFHKECGDEWLKRKSTCPNCTRTIDPEEVGGR